METNSIVMAVLILIVGLPAVWIDSREHRIPNALVIIAVALGVAFRFWVEGPYGTLLALGGLAAGTLLLLPFYLFDAMGAGDVKLMGALGAALGPAGAGLGCALALVAGALLALAHIGWHRLFMPRPVNGVAAPAAPGRIPYAAAIVTGALGAAVITGATA